MKSPTTAARQSLVTETGLPQSSVQSVPPLPVDEPSGTELLNVESGSIGLKNAKHPTTAVFWIQRERARTQNEIIFRHWEGSVASVGSETFTATLRSLLDSTEPEAEAEIPIGDLSADDVELLQPGAIFYWAIGYSVMASGQRKRSSEIKFRRLPAWSKKDIDRVNAKANELYDLFGADAASSSRTSSR